MNSGDGGVYGQCIVSNYELNNSVTMNSVINSLADVASQLEVSLEEEPMVFFLSA